MRTKIIMSITLILEAVKNYGNFGTIVILILMYLDVRDLKEIASDPKQIVIERVDGECQDLYSWVKRSSQFTMRLNKKTGLFDIYDYPGLITWAIRPKDLELEEETE